jgi:hypothetical protein
MTSLDSAGEDRHDGVPGVTANGGGPIACHG